MRQLELFSFGQEEKEQKEDLQLPVEKPFPKKFQSSENGDVVFSDNKISVKIKLKQPIEEQPKVVLPPVQITEDVAQPASQSEIIAPGFQKPASEKNKKLSQTPQKRGRKSFKEIDAELDLVQIPGDEILFEKQYYAISTVAKWFNVNTSLLRYWENEFDALKPRKNKKGDRLFRPEDIKTLQTIYFLLRQQKYTIEGAKEYLKINKKNIDVQAEITQSLNKFKDFLLELKANI